jgi:RES domain-containing protein
VLIWRCSIHASLDGEGGMRASARWHTIGHRITYCSPNPAGALLEALAHLKGMASLIPTELQYHIVNLPDDVSRERILEGSLVRNWRRSESATRSIGDKWLDSMRSAVLEVPSVLAPETYNVLLNPLHADSALIRVVGTKPPARRTIGNAYNRNIKYIQRPRPTFIEMK